MLDSSQKHCLNEHGNYVSCDNASEGQWANYFDRLRPEILRQVPSGAKRVLSLGCGAGRTEGELVRRGISVVGIEMDPLAAEEARKRGIDARWGTIEALLEQFSNERFDCVICADVLEHLPRPELVVRSCVQLLAPNSRLVISIPNFRHYSVLLALVWAGEVVYADAGILDRTHLRITTRRMAERWCREAGLVVCSYEYRMSRRRERWANFASAGMCVELFARQIVVVATRAADFAGLSDRRK